MESYKILKTREGRRGKKETERNGMNRNSFKHGKY